MKELSRNVSMDEGKIRVIENPDGSYVVTKKTAVREVVNMAEMSTHLLKTRLFEWHAELYKVVTPNMISWNETSEVLTLELKEGENLEALLSSEEGDRIKNIDFTRKFLGWMKTTGTFWRGAAPRHIFIDASQKEISLLDFERPVTLNQNGFNNGEFNRMLRGLVHEEFCAFLFEDEQQAVFPNIWGTEVSNEIIRLDSIHGKRIKLLLEKFFGPLDDTVQTEQLHFVYRFMSSVVTPFLIEGKPFYPLKVIDEKTRGAENYVNIALQLSSMDRSRWPEYLGYEIN